MNRIHTVMAQLKRSGKKMLSPYITAGDPRPDMTVKLMHALVKGGADILELGLPFSDPMCEGPVIQHAMERALAQHVHCKDVVDMVKAFRQDDKTTPVVIMSYVNPIEQYGYDKFARHAAEAGIDGTILVDMPPEESSEVTAIWQQHHLLAIYLCSPTTTPARMALINASGQGYLYYVSLQGVSGAETLAVDTLRQQYQQIQSHTSLPLMVGFGIKTPKMAAVVAQFADGVIVGAALVKEIIEAYESKQDPLNTCEQFMHAMRVAIDTTGKNA